MIVVPLAVGEVVLSFF